MLVTTCEVSMFESNLVLFSEGQNLRPRKQYVTHPNDPEQGIPKLLALDTWFSTVSDWLLMLGFPPSVVEVIVVAVAVVALLLLLRLLLRLLLLLWRVVVAIIIIIIVVVVVVVEIVVVEVENY